MLSLTAALAPAVTRRPSWPCSGPEVRRPTDEQLPSARKFVHSSRPMMLDERIVALLTIPEEVSGGVSPVALSTRTPTVLYWSTLLWSMSSDRAVAPAGGLGAAVI